MENDEPTYLHNDLLGSPVAGTDKFGNVIWQEHYTPYGEKILNSAANDDLGSFTGHIDDSSTGLTYMQARYYDPVIGRFLANDPVGFLGHLNSTQGIQGFNRYAYVNNNPYKYTDPDGKAACGGICVGAVIIFIGKEIAGEVFEQTTGVPAPTVKNLGKVAAKKYISRRLRRTQSAKDIKSRTGQRNDGKCEFCGDNQATATDHLETSISEVADAVIEGGMSFDEADAAANNEDNAADSCTSCNSSKGTKKIGRGFNAKNLSNRLTEKLKDKLE